MWPFSKKNNIRESLEANARRLDARPDRTVRPVRDRPIAEIMREEWQEREAERQAEREAEDEQRWQEEMERERKADEARQRENGHYLQMCYGIGIDPIFGKVKPGWGESMKDFYHRMLDEQHRKEREYADWLRRA